MRRSVLYVLTASAVLTSSLPVQAQDAFGVITTNTLDMPTVGDGASFSFSATAGEYVTIAMQNQGSNISAVQLRVLDPNFNTVATQTVVAPPTGTLGQMECNTGSNTAAGCWGSAVINLPKIASTAAGTYTVLATPTAGTGSMTFTVTVPINGDGLVANGGSIYKVSGNPGQSMMLPVSLVSGQSYTLTISETNGYLPAGQGVIFDPSGTVIGNFAMAATCANPCGLGQYIGGGYTVFTADATGTFNILFQQQAQTAGPNVYGPLWNTATWQITSP